ncbi:hypothetical protein CEXT_665461 [Caerostris extrusa]|uniref:Uncharacterized protein n=1 Tax=Caerostris extrusa TaxID=172846 RepID=A0AAV4SKR9_CAEEX|nr:hypothetical protein CEXT_665461 [Caerostris extrusa]
MGQPDLDFTITQKSSHLFLLFPPQRHVLSGHAHLRYLQQWTPPRDANHSTVNYTKQLELVRYAFQHSLYQRVTFKFFANHCPISLQKITQILFLKESINFFGKDHHFTKASPLSFC